MVSMGSFVLGFIHGWNLPWISSVRTAFRQVRDRIYIILITPKSIRNFNVSRTVEHFRLLGRRKTVLIAAAVILLSGYAAAFAKSFVMFTVLRFFLASGVSACYNNCFVLRKHHNY